MNKKEISETEVYEKINDIFEKLTKYANYPDYQLERRLDIFFLIYLKEILTIKDIDISDTFIFPEFPLLKKYENECNDLEKSLASKRADYVVFSNQKMYIIELKTDKESINENQLNHYKKVAKISVQALINDIIKIYEKPNSRAWKKYDILLKDLAEKVKIIVFDEDKDKKFKKKKGYKFNNEFSNYKIEIIYIIPYADKNIKEKLDSKEYIEFDDIIKKLHNNKDVISENFIKILENIKEKN